MRLYCIVYDGEDIVLRDGLLEAAAEQRFVQAVCCCGGQRAEIDAEAFAGVFDPCFLRGPELQEAQRVEPAARRGENQLLRRADARSQRGADGRRASRSMPTGPPCTAQHTKFPEWLQLKAGPSGT